MVNELPEGKIQNWEPREAKAARGYWTKHQEGELHRKRAPEIRGGFPSRVQQCNDNVIGMSVRKTT